MKRLLTALVCLVGVVGVALAAPSTAAVTQDVQMKQLITHMGGGDPQKPIPPGFCGGG